MLSLIAQELREILWVGDNPMEDVHRIVEHIVHTYRTNDPFRLCHELNIHLLPSQTPSGMWGVFIYQAPHAFFSYDMTAPTVRQFTYVAHGLAHYLLHREHDPLFIELDEPGPSILEAEAREFTDLLLHGMNTFNRPLQQRRIP